VKWEIDRTESVHFRMAVEGDRRVVLADRTGVRVKSVFVRYTRTAGGTWDEPRISVSHGIGWDITVTSVPQGLRGQRMPDWLAALVAEAKP
jgi:hypothetical protein